MVLNFGILFGIVYSVILSNQITPRMKPRYFFLLLPTLLFSLQSGAKGHGGGGHSGGHGGGHFGGSHLGHIGAHTSGSRAVTHASFHSRIAARPTGTASSAGRTTASLRGGAVNSIGGYTGVRGNGSIGPRNGEPFVSHGNVHQGHYVYGGNWWFAAPYYYNYYPYYDWLYYCYYFNYGPYYRYTNRHVSGDDLANIPMDGYIVVGNDTLDGTITMNNRVVKLDVKDSANDYTKKYKVRDGNIQAVVLYDNDMQVSFTPLNDGKPMLWRLIHSGKLNLYDYDKGFIYTPQNVDHFNLKAVYDGKIVTMSSIFQNDNKIKLVHCVNEAYGLQLNDDDYTWNELLQYIDKLD